MRFPTTLAVALGSIATILAAPAPAGAVASDPAEVLTIAHRGARHVAPENTLAALRAGIERGADMVEIDVQRTKDGRLVLMHDRDLVRTTNVEKVFPKKKSYDVADLTWAEVRKLDAGAWKRAKFAGERVPTLKQAIRLVYRERAGLLVEIKSPGSTPASSPRCPTPCAASTATSAGRWATTSSPCSPSTTTRPSCSRRWSPASRWRCSAPRRWPTCPHSPDGPTRSAPGTRPSTRTTSRPCTRWAWTARSGRSTTRTT